MCVIAPNFVKIGRNSLQTSETVSWEKRTEASKFTKMGTWGGKGSLKVIGNVTIIRPHMISSSH